MREANFIAESVAETGTLPLCLLIHVSDSDSDSGSNCNSGTLFHSLCARAYVVETGSLRSLDMVEVNPALGANRGDVERTADMGNALVAKMLGHQLL